MQNPSVQPGKLDPGVAAATPASMGSKKKKKRKSAGKTDDFFKSSDLWNNDVTRDRARIREFWLQLREDERRSLVMIEKDDVLVKLKELQRHSCSCSLCGKKKTVTEEELRLLYDAYYEELEEYTSLQHKLLYPIDVDKTMPLEQDRQLIQATVVVEEERQTDNGVVKTSQVHEFETSRDSAPGSIFGKAAKTAIKNGLLHISDDLLNRDGMNFLQVMEQLAEQRLGRESEQYSDDDESAHSVFDQDNDETPPNEAYPATPHDETGHPVDDTDESLAADDEADPESGRRMFQIFAARMFEYRVLTAYREKISREREKLLLEEIEEEKRQTKAKNAGKSKERAGKKKDRRRAVKEKERKEELPGVVNAGSDEKAEECVNDVASNAEHREESKTETKAEETLKNEKIRQK